MHIADAGHREQLWAIHAARGSRDAIGTTYDVIRDEIHLPNGKVSKVLLEADVTTDRLKLLGFDDAAIENALERIKTVR
jgi:hypothetical protein